MELAQEQLKRSLSPLMLWGLGVGYVISGMYFGWNLGLPEGGPYGFLVATLLVTILYVAFVLSYAELSCSLPHAGGAFVYAQKGLGPKLGFIAGIAQWIEFIFAPPAIAAAIGAYFSIFFPTVNVNAISIAAYVLFTGLNIYGVKQSAIFELVITVFAVAELLLFSVISGRHFSWVKFSQNSLPHGWVGILPSLPYAIWFYLAIEGIANVAEESAHPQKDLSLGFISAMATLVVLAVLVFFTAVGVSGWEAVVFKPGSQTPSDSPLPLALQVAVGSSSIFYHLVVMIGLFGLLASFHGIILVAGRATMEFGRSGHLPAVFGKISPSRQTPSNALLINMVLGIAALLTGRTGEIITVSVFGALTMYALSMMSLFALRKNKPELARPFKTPLYPWAPMTALLLSVMCLLTTAYFNLTLAAIYLAIVLVSFVIFRGGKI